MSEPALDFGPEDRPLPKAVLRDLTRAASGQGRTPTTAHPHCVCGKRYRTPCSACGVNYDAPCVPREWETERDGMTEPFTEHFWARRTERVPQWWCPQHRI